VLRLGIDEREDDDLEAEVGRLPFVINRDLADQYGGKFLVSLDKDRGPVVAALP
jgi:hypothetical protein